MFAFWVIMQRRADGSVFADLHKVWCSPECTGDGEFFLLETEAQQALEKIPEDQRRHWHVVRLLASLGEN